MGKLMERIEDAGDIGWEIRRQQNSDGDTKPDDSEEETGEDSTPEILVLQYNAPGTLPWRRTNEIAVVMEQTGLVDDKDEMIAEAGIESDQKESEVKNDEEEESESDESDQKESEVKNDEEEESESDYYDDNSNDEIILTTDPYVE